MATPPTRTAPSIIRSLVPYLLAAIAATAIWGWYFFGYVPPKLQYFQGMRFRTLAVAAQQLTSKIESLSQAVKTAGTLAAPDRGAYLEFVVPELRDGQGAGGIDYEQPLPRHIAWSDVVAQAADASQRDFDDLVLADSSGAVLWQREPNSPRIGNLTELLDARSNADWSLLSLQWSVQTTPIKGSATPTPMPTTATSNIVNLDGRASILLTQPVRLTTGIKIGAKNGEDRLYLAGLVSRSGLQSEAMHVPTEWVVLAMLPFVLVFLALPFVKLATVTAKERYGFADVVALGIAAVLAAAIGGALPFLAGAPTLESDDSLHALAQKIDDNLREEATNFLQLSETVRDNAPAIRARLTNCTVPIIVAGKPERRLCNFWEAIDAVGLKPGMGYAELDVISWIGPDGFQTQKWTAKQQVTALIRQDFQHFQDIRAGRTWMLAGGSDVFTMEPLRSPTTSDMAFVFAVNNYADEKAPVLALNVKPQSLVDAVMPPGYGFAMIAPDGRVLFHSQPALSLQENFLREVGDADAVLHAMRTGKDATWTGDYHGRQHRLYSRPVTAFESCPWRLVTFREIDPLLGQMASRQSGAIAVFALDLLALFLLVAAALLAARLMGRPVMDIILASSIQRRGAVLLSILQLAVLAVAALVALASTYTVRSASLTWIGAFFLLSPFLALAIVVSNRWLANSTLPADDACHFGRDASEIFLVALLVGAIPAAGIARVVYRVGSIGSTVLSLHDSEELADAREARVRAGVQQTSRYSERTKTLLRGPKGFAAMRTMDDWASPASYSEVLDDITPRPIPGNFEELPPSFIGRLLTKMRSWMSGTTIKPIEAEVDVNQQRIRLKEPGANGLYFSAVYDASVPGMVRPWPTVGGIVILCVTFLVVLWSRWTLSSSDMPQAPSLADLVSQIRKDAAAKAADEPLPNPIILMIGPPRCRKDSIVAEVARPDHRIRLLDKTLSSWWIDGQIKDVEAVKSRTTGLVWIHVSNLESQLTGPASRTEVFRLIERLIDRRTGIVVTTTIDPVAHFAEVFLDERSASFANTIPEIELNRSSLLLTRMRRCYAPVDGQSPWASWLHYNPRDWRTTLALETSNHRLLTGIGQEIRAAWDHKADVPMDDLRRAVRTRAEACYQLLWTGCTRSEKLALIQLAQEGLVNPKSRDTLDELIAKGLIFSGPAPELFNFTFRDFLRGIVRNDVVQEWERQDGNGLWVISSRLVAAVLTVGGLFYMLTQGFAVQSMLPILSGSGLLGVPVVKDLVTRFSATKSGVPV